MVECGIVVLVNFLIRRAVIVLALAAVAGSSSQITWAQPQATAQSSLALLAAPLYQQLAALKGMTSPGAPPPILIKSREETRRFIQQEMDRRYSAARIESERKGMVAWGLIPPTYDLRRLFVDLMEEQIAAYYDPVSKVMVVGDWLSPDQQHAAIMHELVHALQDREISLDTFITPHPGQGDQLLARQALMEGEAVALMLALLLKAQGLDLAARPDLNAVRGAVIAGTTGPAVAAAPKFLRDLLIFPYMDGLTFVYQFSKRQPWSAMPTLYRDPPRSTAQILKPEKRLGQREDPIQITLPDLGAVAPGAKIVNEDELGEFALGAVVGTYLGEQAGPPGASGWRGDRYRIWEDADGRFVIAYLLAMDSERAANAFAATYGKVIEKRHPPLAGKEVVGPAALTTWKDGGRTFVVERRGTEVLIMEQMASGAADGVREAIWRSRPTAPKP